LLGGQDQTLNLKNVAIIVLLILVLSMTFSLLNPTMAQSNDVQRQKSETLIRILENDNASILLVFSRFETQNISVPQTAETAYNEGLAQAKNAVSFMNQENYDKANIEAVDAMQKFEDTLNLLEIVLPVEPTVAEVTAKAVILLKANMTRTLEQVERLENLTIKAGNAGYNTLKIENSLSEIKRLKRHLDNATRELSSRNLDGAIEELSLAKTLLGDLKEPFSSLTNFVTELNTATYLQKAEIRVSEVKTNITLSATLTSEAKEEAINALNKSELSLSNARDLLDDSNIDEAIEELEEAKKWEEESSRVIAAVAAIPTSVASTNESVSQTAANVVRAKTEMTTSK
jgi:tetratricopeptide (TPR) repeat protein